jgi:hypothetical protein
MAMKAKDKADCKAKRAVDHLCAACNDQYDYLLDIEKI